MKLSSKIVIVVALMVVICGSALLWWAHQRKAEERKFTEAANSCRLRAAQGDPKAESELGYMFSHGQGVPQDYREAFRWRTKAANQGYADGEEGLGYMYWHGQGVPQDYAEALRLYLMAAGQGDAKAQNNVGIIYEEGGGVPQNYAAALQWYHKAADQNYASAQYNLGNMYYYGRGVPWDAAEARRWYRKAFDQGDHYAQCVLGLRGCGLNTQIKVLLSICAIGSFMLLVGPLFPGDNSWNRPGRSTTINGLLGLCCVGLSIYGRSQFRFFPYEWEVNCFDFFRYALTGIFLILTTSIIVSLTISKRAMVLLGILGTSLLAFDAVAIEFRFAHPAAWAFSAAARLVCVTNGLLVGMVFSVVAIVWRNKTGKSEIGDSDNATSECTAD